MTTLAELRQAAEWHALAIDAHRSRWAIACPAEAVDRAQETALVQAQQLAEAGRFLGAGFAVPEDGDFLDWLDSAEESGQVNPAAADLLNEHRDLLATAWRIAAHLRSDEIRYLVTEARRNPLVWYRPEGTFGQKMYLSEFLACGLSDLLDQDQRLALMRGEPVAGVDRGERFTVETTLHP